MATYPSPPRSSSTISKPDVSSAHPGYAAPREVPLPETSPDRSAYQPTGRHGARESHWHEPDLTPLSPKPCDLTFKPAIGGPDDSNRHSAAKHAEGSSSPSLPVPPRYVYQTYTDGDMDRTAPEQTYRRSVSSPPKPIYYSPRNPPPSPYNTARPQPRPGFLYRLRARISRLSIAILRWIRRHPVAATLLSAVPIIVGVGAFKGIKALSGIIRSLRSKKSKGGKKKDQKWGYGLDDFANFAGSKGGPLEGLLMILKMAIDHYCRLTHSAIPRAASILLQLYFIETGKKSHL